MNEKRIGEKVGWIGGWIGSFVWVFILAIISFYKHEVIQGIVGVILTVVAVISVLYYTPWRYPSTAYWKLMIIPYCMFFSGIAWCIWAFGAAENLNMRFDWWNVFWFIPLFSPIGFLGNRTWVRPK